MKLDVRSTILVWGLLGLAVWLGSGCASFGPPTPVPPEAMNPDTEMRLSAGDEIDVVFFSAPNLNTTQTIRRDGKVSFSLLGEVQAAGQTLSQLRTDLVARASSQLQVKDLNVILKSSAPVFVEGAVKMPGPVPLTRPLTVLDAIAYAGGFDLKDAEVRNVVVIRYDGNRCQCWRLNFEGVLAGQPDPKDCPFYLKPLDIIHVPAQISL